MSENFFPSKDEMKELNICLQCTITILSAYDP